MKLVMAAAECVPFVKTGGLADVAGALPKELAALGHEVTVILPKYSLIPEKYSRDFGLLEKIMVPFAGTEISCSLYELELDDVHYVFVENDDYYAREQIYSQEDDGERFAFFNKAVLAALQARRYKADILHVHDWHTAMIPFMLAEDERYSNLKKQVKTVLTIHNLQFQGVFSKKVFLESYGLDENYFEQGSVEWYGNFNMLKAGIAYADRVTTVSPSYRDEILTEQYGEGLHPLLQERKGELTGILNGLDTREYNPATDLAIELEFDHTSVEGKAVNKRAVQSRFGLPKQGGTALAVMVSRLAGQKGIDVLEETLPEILDASDMQFVLLGSGEEKYEDFFRRLETDYPGQVASYIGFDEELAHLLYAGADIFLMPSHFEPCGLSQLISMRYGTVPVVNKTGGLKDTVLEYDENSQTGNGFLSDFSNHETFSDALKRALAFYQRSDHWQVIKQNGMTGDYSWSRSATEYEALYDSLIRK